MNAPEDITSEIYAAERCESRAAKDAAPQTELQPRWVDEFDLASEMEDKNE